MNHKFNIKPLSANRMLGVRGRRSFKSPEYIAYQNEIRDDLMGIEWPFGTDQVSFKVEAGLSNRGADIDNVIKPLLDTYQGVFDDFNDNKVYHIELNKAIVKKGEEYLDVTVEAYNKESNTNEDSM